MNPKFGLTRTVVKSRYALITPDGFVPSVVPGWKNAVIVLNIAPVMGGPRFAQWQVTLAANGEGQVTTGSSQYFIYAMEGAGSVALAGKRHALETGSYIYVPPGMSFHIRSSVGEMKLLIFQKPYQRLKGATVPKTIVGHERGVKGEPFLGNPDARLQVLLPDDLRFDMAVNIFTYQPGATLPFVETHIMEHGLLMLRGGGLYRLDADEHEVRAGDVIWMASYCPQWFIAKGKTPASYIYYKDVNRMPL
jgi:(S)-ureidoglycine aminohydrolase